MEKLDTQQVILGTLIALLRRQFPPLLVKEQVLEGMRLAKGILVDADIAKEGGDLLIVADTISRMDVVAQMVGVYLQPEWATRTGIDKNFIISGLSLAFQQASNLLYTVPAGKTLFVCGLSFYSYAEVAANADLNQMGFAYAYNLTTKVELAAIGGNGGNGITLPKPVAIPAGNVFLLAAYCVANHLCHVEAYAWGYEV